jgi:hypothetical protein
MFKQITLAALAAMFITGSAALADAESNVSGSDPASSAGMQNDMRDKMGAAGFAAAPSTNTSAYGYAPETRPARPHHSRSSAKTKHNR